MTSTDYSTTSACALSTTDLTSLHNCDSSSSVSCRSSSPTLAAPAVSSARIGEDYQAVIPKWCGGNATTTTMTIDCNKSVVVDITDDKDLTHTYGAAYNILTSSDGGSNKTSCVVCNDHYQRDNEEERKSSVAAAPIVNAPLNFHTRRTVAPITAADYENRVWSPVGDQGDSNSINKENINSINESIQKQMAIDNYLYKAYSLMKELKDNALQSYYYQRTTHRDAVLASAGSSDTNFCTDIEQHAVVEVEHKHMNSDKSDDNNSTSNSNNELREEEDLYCLVVAPALLDDILLELLYEW